jgi:hypothetical protein
MDEVTFDKDVTFDDGIKVGGSISKYVPGTNNIVLTEEIA